MLGAYINAFPLTPLGGAFVLPVGLCTMLGAALPRYRLALVGVGFVLGLALLWLLAKPLAPGIPPVHRFAVYSLLAAVAVEVLAFATVMPRVRDQGVRAAGLASLLIVGAHFLVMIPAFGPLIGGLGIAALVNAGRAWRRPASSFLRTWAIDGALKICFAATMLATAPALY